MKKIRHKFILATISLLLISLSSELFGRDTDRGNIFIDREVKGLNAISMPVSSSPTTLQLFSHGRPGQLLLNGRWRDAAEIAVFLQARHLTDGTIRQVNIYGCEFAKSQIGLDAVARLQKALGIPVAASTDITGSEGNWILEVGGNKDVLAVTSYIGSLQCAGAVGGTAPGDDLDGDGICNNVDLDDDNDGILDAVEVCRSAPIPTSFEIFNFEDTSTVTNETLPFDQLNQSKLVLKGQFTPTISGYLKWNTVAATDFVQNNINTNGTGSFTYQNGYTDEKSVMITIFRFTIPASTVPGSRFSIRRDFFGDGGLYVLQNGVLVGGMCCGDEGGPSNSNISLTTSPGGDVIEIRAANNIPQAVGAQFQVLSPSCPPTDTDGDGLTNDLDLDSDGDGCPDAKEAGVTGTLLNGNVVNGTPNTTTSLPNAVAEGPYGLNGLANPLEGGNDGSSATTSYNSTYDPVALSKTLNACADTDNDGIPDVVDIDDDNDGILDAVEAPSCYYTATEATKILSVSSEISSYQSNVPDNTIDNNASTYNAFTDVPQNWAVKELYRLTAATPVEISSLQLDPVYWVLSTDGNQTFRLQGSGDGTSWTDLSAPVASATTGGTFTIANTQAPPQPYKYYRLVGVAGNSSIGGVSEIRLIAAPNYVPSAHAKPICSVDTDGDGITNDKDLDSDGDGCPDAVEAGVVTPGNPVPASQYGVIQNGSGGVVTTNSSVSNAVVSGPYGTNGFANSVETAAGSNQYRSAYTYNLATDGVKSANCNLVVLASHWLSLEATLRDGAALVSWKVVEQDVDHYIVQRSVNGRDFNSIGTVGVQHSGAAEKGYGYIDKGVIGLDVAKVFYRVISVDHSSQKELSEIVSVSLGRGGKGIFVYPDPIINGRLGFNSLQKVRGIDIYNASGALVRQFTVSDRGRLSYDISGLPNGLYIVRLRKEDGGTEHIRVSVAK